MTIKDLVNRAADESGDKIALRFKLQREWKTCTYRELRRRVWHVAEMCAQLGAKPGDRVALYRENAPGWQEIYLGIASTGMTAVPVDPKLREQEVAHILRDAGVGIVFASARLYSLLSDIEDSLPELKAVVLLGGQSVLPVPEGRVEYHDFDTLFDAVSVTANSDARVFDRFSAAPDDVASIIYTSGTTGRSKGAMLTHRNFISNAEGSAKVIEVLPDDNFLVLLPLHHSFAFTASFLIPLYAQCEASMVESLKTIAENMADTRPTVLIAVPLLLEKMLNRIIAGIEKRPVAGFLYKTGMGRVVGRGVIKKLGGRLRLVISGGAPIDPAVLKGWSRLGVMVREGYGITETAPVLTLNPIRRPKLGSVGLPLPEVELKIVNPDKDGSGEIAVRGPNVMKGYFKKPRETEEVLQNGWYYTGDLGFLDKRGYLTINGRKKSLIVSREGKNIYPEEVEQVICHSPFVLECIVLGYREPGTSVGEQVGAIVVPDQDAIDEMFEGDRTDDKAICELMRGEVRKQCERLSDYKRPRYVQVNFEEFEKTSTQKIKRYLYAIDTSVI